MTPFPPFNQLKACRHGQMLYNIHDMYIGRSLDLYGEFSEGEVEFFRQAAQPGYVILEIGANIGAHTLFFAQQVGPSGCVLAFEPQRIVFQTLCANMALNCVTNTWCFHQAVGAEMGHLMVPVLDYTQVNNYGGLGLGNFQQGERVAVVTIDSLDLRRCDLIKIDVEGMEEAVLRGAVETLAKFKPILYVENDREDRSASLIRFIDALAYAMYWHLPPLYNVNNFLNNAEDVFPGIVSKNMLCVPRSRPHQLQGFQAVQIPSAD
jgi:FkbM family methyltransferase